RGAPGGGEKARAGHPKRRPTAAQAEGLQRRRPSGGRRAGGGDLPPRGGAEMRPDRGRTQAESLVRLALVARVGGENTARPRAVQHLRRADGRVKLITAA